jgi:hypothetical protein
MVTMCDAEIAVADNEHIFTLVDVMNFAHGVDCLRRACARQPSALNVAFLVLLDTLVTDEVGPRNAITEAIHAYTHWTPPEAGVVNDDETICQYLASCSNDEIQDLIKQARERLAAEAKGE